MFYFAEIDDEGKITTLHESTSVDTVLRNSEGVIVPLTEMQHGLLTACRMKPSKGHYHLKEVETKISTFLKETKDCQE